MAASRGAPGSGVRRRLPWDVLVLSRAAAAQPYGTCGGVLLSVRAYCNFGYWHAK